MLRRSLRSLLDDLFVRFVKPAARFQKDVLNVKYDQHTLSGAEIMIGNDTWSVISERKKHGKLNDEKLNAIYSTVKNFYLRSSNYIV